MLGWRRPCCWVVGALAAGGCGARTPIWHDEGRGEVGASDSAAAGTTTGGSGACAAVDADLDGHAAPPCGDDCDDSDPTVFPGALDAPPGATPWSFETVDAEGSAGYVSSIAVDHSGRPHVSYYGAPKWPAGPQQVRYARRLDAGWEIETVVEGDAAPFFYTSLALGADAMPHIAFCSTEVEYAAASGAGFDVMPIATSDSGAASHCSIALDESGAAHIAYHADNTINYATSASGAFETEQIGEEFFAGTWADLALDANGTVFVVYRHTGVWLASKRPSGDWQMELVDPTPSSYTSLALDRDNNPNVAYIAHADGDDELRFARWTRDGWILETVDAPAEELGYAAIAVDEGGVVHVAYENFGAPPGGQLRYARRDAAGWSFEIPDPDVPGGSWTSIAIGTHGVVHLSYLYAGARDAYDLRWARRMVADGIDQDCDGTDG